MMVEIDNLITLTSYGKVLGVSRQRVNQIKNTLPIVLIDGQPFVDKSRLGIIDSNNIRVDTAQVIESITIDDGNEIVDY